MSSPFYLNCCHPELVSGSVFRDTEMKNEQYNYSSLPSTRDDERDQSIDTSPSAHILIVGKEFDPGIMVYCYNPKNQTLKKIWDAK